MSGRETVGQEGAEVRPKLKRLAAADERRQPRDFCGAQPASPDTKVDERPAGCQ